MVAQEKQIEKKVLFWSLLGPFLIISTLLILLFKVSTGYMYIPVAALIGVPVCWHWKTKGLIAVLGAFFLFLMVHFFRFTDLISAWNIGLAIALALAFVVTTLSFKEIETLFSGIQVVVPQTVDQQQTIHQQTAIISKLEKALTDKQELILSQDRLIELSREELVSLHHEKEALHGKLADSLAEMGKLEENYEDLEQERQRLIQEWKESQQHVQTHPELEKAKQRLVEKDKQLEQLRILLDHANSKTAQLQHYLETTEVDLTHLKDVTSEYEKAAENTQKIQQQNETIREELNTQINHFIREKSQLETSLGKLQNEYEELKGQLESAQQRLDVANQEMQMLKELAVEDETAPPESEPNSEFRRVEGLYKQLREQFTEKSDVLDATRKELFHTQEALEALRRDIKEQTDFHCSEEEIALIKLFQTSEEEIASLQNEVEDLHSLISKLVSGSV